MLLRPDAHIGSLFYRIALGAHSIPIRNDLRHEEPSIHHAWYHANGHQGNAGAAGASGSGGDGGGGVGDDPTTVGVSDGDGKAKAKNKTLNNNARQVSGANAHAYLTARNIAAELDEEEKLAYVYPVAEVTSGPRHPRARRHDAPILNPNRPKPTQTNPFELTMSHPSPSQAAKVLDERLSLLGKYVDQEISHLDLIRETVTVNASESICDAVTTLVTRGVGAVAIMDEVTGRFLGDLR